MLSKMNNNFVHFRSQSSYSILESILTIEDILKLVQKFKMDSVCISDRKNMFGALEFSVLSKKYKIHPIHACIMNLFFPSYNNFSEILLIAKNKKGFANLLKLMSKSFLENEDEKFPYIKLQDLFHHNEGLIVLSSYTEGIIGKKILSNKIDDAIEISKKFLCVFGNRFYFEIMRHGINEEKIIEEAYINISHELNIPLIATNKIMFASKDKYEIHDVFRCISSGEKINDEQRIKLSKEFYFKSSQEMQVLFQDLPSAIENAIYLAQRCSFAATTINKPIFPSFSEERSEEELLISQAHEGLLKRFHEENFNWEIYKKRLDYELSVILKMNFAGYFLIVGDFVNWSKQNNIAVGPGRGSGAGSIIAWSLNITDLDPIKYGLLFERFLNPERVSLPDFDIDFAQDKRDQVIEYVLSKYGFDKVAHIITFGKMQAKSVVKDVSRVIGLRYEIADYITELIPFNAVSPVTLVQALKEVKELKSAFEGKGLSLFAEDKGLIKKVLDISLNLEGLHRNSSTHAAGIVISANSLDKHVPIYKDQNSKLATIQYSMKYVELSGLVKFDFLGLQTLSLIQNTLNTIHLRGIKIDIKKIDYNDQKVYQMLAQGLSTGVFQFESQGIKSALKALIPDNINDIIALGALYRPGPMDNIKSYINRKHKREKIEYLHPMLEQILKSTYGIIIYQEQVIEIAQKIANYTIASADILRRAMGKKIRSQMEQQETKFIQGAQKNNIDTTVARKIFEHVQKFAGYGFNKSHASAYGIITYQTAYLKAHFTLEFMISALNLELHDSDKIFYLINDLKNFNIKITSPSINESEVFFSKSPNKNNEIIFSLISIKNMTESLAHAIYNERKLRGKFVSILDFVERIDNKLINKRILENLIKSDAFFSLHKNRNRILASLVKLLKYSEHFHKNKDSVQMNFVPIKQGLDEVLIPNVKNIDNDNNSEFANQEFESLGMFIKYHPLHDYKSMLDRCNIVDSNKITQQKENFMMQRFKISGVIVKKNVRMSKRGRFIILTLSDTLGIVEANIFDEELLQNVGKLLSIKCMVILTCYFANGKMIVSNVEDLVEYLTNFNFKFNFYLGNNQEVENSIININKKSRIELQNSSISFFLKLKNGFFALIDKKFQQY